MVDLRQIVFPPKDSARNISMLSAQPLFDVAAVPQQLPQPPEILHQMSSHAALARNQQFKSQTKGQPNMPNSKA